MTKNHSTLVTMADVLGARQVTQSHIWHTPLLPSPSLSKLSGGEVYLKLECWQRTGSFKVRGALNKLASLSPEEWSRGIVTASAGNHGLGVAYACQVLGLPPVTIFVPCQEHDALYISAYDDPIVIAGQATAGLEALEDLPDADLFIVPVGGGGLIAGIATVAKAINPAVCILGVQPAASPSAHLSLRDGHPYETYPAAPTICDGLAGGFGRVPFELAADLIDDVLVVPEADVRRAVFWLLAQEQLVVEGSGAIAIAPLLNGQLRTAARKVVAVLTGRNLDAALLHEILAEQADP
ncbi:MAG: threonine/serine dehydratase [Anaerolineae bacterium]